MKPSLFASVLGLTACLLGSACDRPPPADGLQEWTAKDHDHADEKEKLMSGGSSTGSGKKGAKGAKGAKSDPNADAMAIIEATWQQRCALCHGAEGRGDGPQGPMVKAPDLTRRELESRSDDELMEIVRKGKGLMPPQELPNEMVKGMVALIRARGRLAAQGIGPGAPPK